MQNKPNFPKSQMNVNPYNTTDYENKSNWTLGQNKPNSNPNKPNCRKAQMNVNSVITKDYKKNDDFVVRINKPNFRNGQNERNLTYNKGLQKKRLFSTPKNKPNSNPISSKAKMNLKSLAGKSGHALVVPGLIFSLNRYSTGCIITPVGGTKKQRSRRLLKTFFFSSVITEQKVGIIS